VRFSLIEVEKSSAVEVYDQLLNIRVGSSSENCARQMLQLPLQVPGHDHPVVRSWQVSRFASAVRN
jgi:hypothetical protein